MSYQSLADVAAPFTLKIAISAPVAKVRDAWLDRRQIEQWFLKKAENWDPDGNPSDQTIQGGRVRWTWVEMTADEMSIFEVSDDHVTYGWYGDKGRVTVKWEAEGDETILSIHEDMLDTDPGEAAEAQVGCMCGWAFWMGNLKAWLEHGVNLREERSDRAGFVNV